MNHDHELCMIQQNIDREQLAQLGAQKELSWMELSAQRIEENERLRQAFEEEWKKRIWGHPHWNADYIRMRDAMGVGEHWMTKKKGK